MSAATALVHLYPPSWRRRYATEFVALLDDTGVRLRDVADVLPAAALAWLRPPAHLHGPDARLRATVGVTLFAWVGLVAGAALFGKLTEHADRAAWLYRGYEAGTALSVLAILLGGIPLAASIVRATRRHVALLTTPLLAVLGFAAFATAVHVLVPRSTQPGVGVGVSWFTALVVLGLVAGAAGAAGPALAVHRGRAGPHALTAAVVACACVTAAMSASTLAALGFALARHGGGGFLTGYATVAAGLVAVAATSCRRGVRVLGDARARD